MQTVITAFEDRATAQRAFDRLVESGIARDDIHIRHTGDAPHRGALDAIGHFFTSLFGLDHQKSYAGTYTAAAQGGRAVLVVDVRDEQQAELAMNLMHGEGSTAKPDIVERSQQPRLRDIVLTSEDPLQSTSTVTEDKVLDQVSSLAIEGRRELNADEKERALASKSDVFRDKPSRE